MDPEKLIEDLIRQLRMNQANTKVLIAKAKAEKDSLEALEKLNTEFKKQYESLKKSGQLTKEEQQKLEETIRFTDKEIEQKKINLDYQKKINRANKTLLEGFVGLADASTTGGEKISYYTGAFKDVPIFGSAIDALGKSLDNNINNFRLLADAGADFGQSLIGLRLQARDGLLPLGEFIDFIGNNTSAIAGLFGSVNNGTQAVSLLQRSIRSQLIPELSGLGITTENLNEFLGTFFELQRVQGRTNFLNQEQSTEALRQYSLQLDAVAKLTGIQRSNLDKLVKQQKDDSVFQSFLQGLDTERATQLQTFIAGLQGLNPALGDAVKNILATGFPLGEFESMLVGTSSGLMDNILALREGNINVGQFAQALASSSNDFLRSFSPEVLRAAGSVGEVGNALITFRRRFDSLDEIQRQQLLTGDALTGQLGETQEAFRQLKAAFEGLNTSGLMVLSDGLAPMLYAIEQGAKLSTFVLQQTQRFSPELAAGISLFANAAQYIYPEAKQIAIIAAGNKLAQPGMLRGFGQILGKGLMPLISIAAAIGAMAQAFRYVRNIFQAREQGGDISSADMYGLAGNVLGALVAGILTRGKSKSAIALGSLGGGYIGEFLGKGVDSIRGRAYGGGQMAGELGLVGERGPEFFKPNSAGQVSPMLIKKTATGVESTPLDKIAGPNMSELQGMISQQNQHYKAFADASAKMERHLNTLIGISAKTEKNTDMGTRRLAKLSTNLV